MLDTIAVRLNLLAGMDVPLPPPAEIMDALDSAEIAISDTEPSGFSIIFKAQRSPYMVGDYPILKSQNLKAGARIVATGIFGVKITVLIDGIIEDADFNPGDSPGSATLTIKGRDLTALMDKEERQESYPGLGPMEIVMQILSRYSRYGIIPDIRPPLSSDRNNPVEETPMQTGTDLEMIQELAAQYDHIFTLIPGPTLLNCRAYWGPPPRIGELQPALTLDMGSGSNVSGLKFENTQSESAQVEGETIDSTTGQTVPIASTVSLRPPLATEPAIAARTAQSRILRPEAGQSPSQALAQAQAQSDATTDTLKVTGDLDLGAYGRLLQPRKLVGLRGAGFQHDGLYYVKDVVHTITPGSWSQGFTAVREGLGTTTPIVRP